MEKLMRKASHSAAIFLIRRGFAAKYHNPARDSRVPIIDFSSIREAKDAVRLFHTMVAMSPQPSFLVYNKLLSVVAKMEEYSVALSLFDKMRQSSFPVNNFTMNIIINCCSHLNLVDFGFAVLGSFMKQGYGPDVVTFNTLKHTTFSYNTMIHGFFHEGRVADVWKLYKNMEALHVHQDLYTYNILLDGLCRYQEIGEAFLFLRMMESKGVNPDIITYGILINALCNVGKHDDARDVFNQLPSKGLRPNVQIYTIFISSLYKEGLDEEAKCLLNVMEKNGLAPDDVTYNSIVHSLLKRNEVYKAIPFLEEMYNRGFVAHSANTTMLLDIIVNGKGTDMKLVEVIKKVVLQL